MGFGICLIHCDCKTFDAPIKSKEVGPWLTVIFVLSSLEVKVFCVFVCRAYAFQSE